MDKLAELKEELGSLNKQRRSLADKLVALAEKEDFDEEDQQEYNRIKDQITDIDTRRKIKNDAIEMLEDQLGIESDGPAGRQQPPEGTMGNQPTQPRTVDPEKQLYELTGAIFTTLANKGLSQEKKLDRIGDMQQQLYQGGHYDNFVNAVDGFNTLTDKDGGVFMPTTVSERIFEIAEEYGVFSRFGLRLPMSSGDGTTKIPNLLGQLTFYAVNEGSEATASKLTFSGINVSVLKWMTYVPWTSEMDDLQGRRLVEILLRKLGEALARMRDEAIVNADGTASYHNLKGLVTRGASADFAEVRESVAATGNTTFSDIDPDDFLNATLDIAKSIRGRLRFVLDPDWRVYLKQMKDSNGIPFYANGSGIISVDEGQYMIHDVPVEFTEAVPSTDGADNVYGVAFVEEYYAFADDGNFIVEQFDTGQIPNTDGTSNAINLLSQDMKAARVKTFFDFELSQVTRTYDSTEYGAFTVLKTAAS